MKKVLLVEDENLIRRGLKFQMDWTAVNCVVAGEAASGQEGLEQIQNLQPDIVITDIRMPDMDGLEMLAAGQAERERKCPPTPPEVQPEPVSGKSAQMWQNGAQIGMRMYSIWKRPGRQPDYLGRRWVTCPFFLHLEHQKRAGKKPWKPKRMSV